MIMGSGFYLPNMVTCVSISVGYREDEDKKVEENDLNGLLVI